MKNLIPFFIVFILLVSCGDENTSGPNNNYLQYYIYYSLSQQKGWRPEHSGLYRFEYPDYKDIEKINNYSIIHTTRVAKNGVIAFVIDNPVLSLNIRFEDGTIQKIILPEFSGKVVELLLFPKPEISMDGRKLCYFVKVFPINSQNEMDTFYILVIYDILNSGTELYYTNEFVFENVSSIIVKHTEPLGDNLLVNADASEIHFVTKLYDLIDNKLTKIGYAVFELKNKKLKSYSEIYQNEIVLIGKIYELNTFIIKGDNKVFKYIPTQPIQEVNIPYDNLISFHQFDENYKNVVLWDDDGLSLYNAKNFEKIKTIIKWETLQSKFDDIYKKTTNYITISPDGKIVSFALNPKGDDQSFHLFSIKEDGTGLMKILPFTPINFPVISYGFNIE